MFGLACNIAGFRREGPPWNCRKRVQILQAFEFIRGNTEMASWRPLVFYESRCTQEPDGLSAYSHCLSGFPRTVGRLHRSNINR
jgi:hypothetical protein